MQFLPAFEPQLGEREPLTIAILEERDGIRQSVSTSEHVVGSLLFPCISGDRIHHLVLRRKLTVFA